MEEIKKIAEDINSRLDEMKKATAGKVDADTLKSYQEEMKQHISALKEMNEKELKGSLDKVQKQFDELDVRVKEAMQHRDTAPKSLIENIKAGLDANKEAMKQKGRSVEFEAKVSTIAANISPSTALNEFVLPGVSKDPAKVLYYPSLLPGSVLPASNADAVYYWYRSSVTRSAAMVANDAQFNGGTESAAVWTKSSTPIKKVGDFMKLDREMLEDTTFVASEIDAFIRQNVLSLLNTQMLSGNGVGANMTGLLTHAKSFAKLTGYTTLAANEATEYDVLRSAITQVNKGNNATDSASQGFMPSAIFMNPVDVLNMKTVKDTEGNYLTPYFISYQGNQMLFDGVPVYPDWTITAGTFLVGATDAATWYQRRAFEIMMTDTNGTDFEYDRITIKASVRAALKVDPVQAFGWVTGTFDAGKTALETA